MSFEHFSSYSSKVPYQALTPQEADHFLTHGWLKVPDAIKPEYIDAWMADFWVRTGYNEHDRSTWKDEYLHLPHQRQVRYEEFCPKAWRIIVDICGGEDRIHPVRERWVGDNFIANFGSEDRSKSPIETSPKERRGWHCDNDWYRQFLDSSGTALTIVHCFTNIPAHGGGTWVCEDGIARKSLSVSIGTKTLLTPLLLGVVQYLYNHPEGLDPGLTTGGLCGEVKSCEKFVPIVAKRGDVFILHGLLPHVASLNHLHYARVITNPHVTLKEEYNLNRIDSDYVSLAYPTFSMHAEYSVSRRTSWSKSSSAG